MNQLRTLKRRFRRRPLQIDEICAAAGEFLAAAALRGLGTRYLPASLTVHLSSADLDVLRPFETELATALQRKADQLAARPDFARLSDALSVELLEAVHLSEGELPEFTAGFPEGATIATWSPADSEPSAPGRASNAAESTEGDVGAASSAQRLAFVLVITSADEGATSVQTRYRVCFGDGTLPEGTVQRGRDDAGKTVYMIAGDTIVIGREPEQADLVPDNAAAVLSARHLALNAGEGGEISLIDLGSTNGTFVAGEQCTPTEPVLLDLPVTIDIGSRGAMRIEVARVDSASIPR